jgi:threonine dehydratase
VQKYGGTTDLIDTRLISRAERVRQLLAEQEGAFQAHAYDDYRVVAGNSTLGREIFRADSFDILVVPVGGGGLCAGQIVARDHVNARTEIIGAEPQLANDAARSLRSGQLVRNETEPPTVADGARTVSLGDLNWEILRTGIADILEVPDPVTLEALRAYFALNLKVEATGALALGALLANPERFAGKRVCCIVSGGNIDPLVYAQVLQEGQGDVAR